MLTAILVAAGSSQRMGFDKLLATIADKPVIAHSIAAFERTFISTGTQFDRMNQGQTEEWKYNSYARKGFDLFTDTKGANRLWPAVGEAA